MKFNLKPLFYLCLSTILFLGCGSTADILSTPVENIDTSPLKVTDLTETEKKNWGHLDLERDTIPGMAIDRAYTEIIKGKKGRKVIVAVIDTGIDIDHEDLDGVIWTNKKEVPNNGKDDDNNGYVDDIHGWNFLGDTYNEQFEYVRLLASGDASNPRYQEAKELRDSEYQKYISQKTQYDQIAQAVNSAHETLKKETGKSNYTIEDVNKIKSNDQNVQQAVQIANNIHSNDLTMAEAIEEIKGIQEQINEYLNVHLNKNLFIDYVVRDSFSQKNSILALIDIFCFLSNSNKLISVQMAIDQHCLKTGTSSLIAKPECLLIRTRSNTKTLILPNSFISIDNLIDNRFNEESCKYKLLAIVCETDETNTAFMFYKDKHLNHWHVYYDQSAVSPAYCNILSNKEQCQLESLIHDNSHINYIDVSEFTPPLSFLQNHPIFYVYIPEKMIKASGY